MRVYLAATLPLLAEWLAAGEAVVAPSAASAQAYAVTPGLREWYREADLDELEHAAQVAASVGSLELLAAQPQAPRRRVVVAADAADASVVPMSDLGRAAIRLAGPVPVSGWGSALVDDTSAGPVVEAAIACLAAAAAGDEDAQFVLDEAEAHELGWYAVQELPDLMR